MDPKKIIIQIITNTSWLNDDVNLSYIDKKIGMTLFD